MQSFKYEKSAHHTSHFLMNEGHGICWSNSAGSFHDSISYKHIVVDHQVETALTGTKPTKTLTLWIDAKPTLHAVTLRKKSSIFASISYKHAVVNHQVETALTGTTPTQTLNTLDGCKTNSSCTNIKKENLHLCLPNEPLRSMNLFIPIIKRWILAFTKRLRCKLTSQIKITQSTQLKWSHIFLPSGEPPPFPQNSLIMAAENGENKTDRSYSPEARSI